MSWNRELAGFIINILMLICVIFLIIRRKNLGNSITYFTTAIGLLTLLELSIALYKCFNKNFNTTPIYIVGANFFVFLFFLLYFQKILYSNKLKKINGVIIILFLLNYFLCALFIEDFFTKMSFFTYFVEVVLLTGSINLVLSQTFNSDKILLLSTYFPFWVCISMLIIYLGVLPLLIISSSAALTMNIQIFFAILFLVNLVGYSILLVGIIRGKDET